MRLFRVLVVAALVAALTGVSPLLAESAGWVSGHVLDAGGRPLASIRVELVAALQGHSVGVPVQQSITDRRGAWSFGSVPAGEYVVRMVYRDRTTGVPVSVTEASGAPGVLIVAPSLPSPRLFAQAQGAPAAAGAGGVSTLAVVGGIAAAAATAAAVLVLRDES